MSLINQKVRFASSKFKREVKVKRLQGEHSAAGFEARYREETLTAIVMPTTTNDVALLPEGERYLPSLKIFTLSRLNIGDLVHFRGFDYRVSACSDWGDYGYFNQIAVRHSATAKIDSMGFDVT